MATGSKCILATARKVRDMEVNERDYLDRALMVILPSHLKTFVLSRLRTSANAIAPADLPAESADFNDLSTLIRILTFRDRNGRFCIDTGPELRSKLHDLRQARNSFAHGGYFDRYRTMAVLTEVSDVLRLIDASAGLPEIAELIEEYAASWSHGADNGADEGAPHDTGPAADQPAATDVGGSPAEQVPQGIPTDAPGPAAASPLDAVQVELDLPPVLSYAEACARTLPPLVVRLSLPPMPDDAPEGAAAPEDSARPGLPAVRRLVLPPLHPGTVFEVKDLVVEISVEGDGVGVAGPCIISADLLREDLSRRVELVLDRSALLQMTSQVVSTVTVTMRSGGVERTANRDGPLVLAARQWILSGRTADVAAALVTFVQPQQPEIPALCRQAAEILEKSTGSNALQGYQAPPERVDQIVSALCRALHERGIAYANPPTNWGTSGQYIRTAEDVLDKRLGTCLDTVVLLASALEYLDIQPLLFIFGDHALLGYWKVGDHGSEQVIGHGRDLVNQIDRGEIGLVETTMLTASRFPELDALHAEARREIGPSGSLVAFVISVHEARDRGIVALPARGLSDEGDVVEVTYTPARRASTTALPEQALKPRRDRTPRELAPERVEVWKRELLDLGLRNRLINCSQSARDRHAIVELAIPDPLIGGFEDRINAGNEITLRPGGERAAQARRLGAEFREELDPPVLGERLAQHHEVEVDLTADNYDGVLQKLATDARTLVEETGANNLYLTLGSLVWTTGDKEVRSPLVLIPVELARGSRRSPFRLSIDATGTTTPNYSLLERLSADLGLSVPGLAEPEEDDSGIDVDAVFDTVRKTLIREQLPFHVEPTTYLGIFKFGSFRLWKDLEESWRCLEKNPLVHHLIHEADEPFLDPTQDRVRVDLDSLVQRLPLPADASQAEVVAQGLAGRTIVVEGPPGTGKSQTITNLIVRAVADGKKVLFVAEKQAALDVVTRRLEQGGVADMALNLYDRNQRATAVRQSLLRALDVRPECDEEGLRAQQAVAQTAGTVLAEYRDHLHEENSAGFSFYGARTRLLTNQGVDCALDIPPQALAHLTKAQVDSLRAACPGLAQVVLRQDPHYVGAFGYLREPVPDANLGALMDAVDRIGSIHRGMDPDARAVVDEAEPAALELLSEALSASWLGVEDFSSVSRQEWWRNSRLLDAALRSCAQVSTGVWSYYRVEAVEGPLDEVRSALVDAKNAIFGRTKRAEKALSPLAPYRTGEPMPQDAGVLLGVVDELIALRQRCAEAAGLYAATMPDMWRYEQGGWFPFDRQSRDRVFQALDWYRRLSGIVPSPGCQPTPLQSLAMGLMTRPDRGSVAQSVRGFLTAAEALRAAAPDAHIKLSEVLSADPGMGDRPSRHRALQAWNDLNGELVGFRAAGLQDAAQEVIAGKVDPALLPIAFERGIARASLEERGARANFALFDARRQRDFVRRFSDATAKGKRVLPAVLLREALDQRDKVIEREPIRMGQLHRELMRKRGGRKIRDLIAQYGDLITAIKPCVLVSPDSAARFFPADRQDFDMVVFDEASQITVASAVGAMARGRSVVICGDSQQLPPTSFAEMSREEEFSDEGLCDEESVLGECVADHVPRHWLSWHYRSQVESLIAFSNQAYYEGRLSSFPSALPAVRQDGQGGYGVQLRRVDGTFHRHVGGDVNRRMLRTNPIEARAVVDEIRARQEAAGSRAPSIGVVTFNGQQRELIETMLRELDDPSITASLDASDGLFVKNLENVQGDERDTILFSLGFSADEKGNVPLNFGPLNKEGGERRLNVAITRARRQVILFCSFDPVDLHVERSESVGLGHLREYLDMAASGAQSITTKAGAAHITDRHRDEIAAALRARGLSVTTDVGLSDFRIDLVLASPQQPGRPLVAVLLDGVHWGHRRTVFDRDSLPEQVLGAMMGWPAVERVWMPEWINDPGAVVNRLVQSVDSAARVEEPVPDTQAASTDTVSTEDSASIEDSGGQPGGPAVPANCVGTVPEAVGTASGSGEGELVAFPGQAAGVDGTDAVLELKQVASAAGAPDAVAPTTAPAAGNTAWRTFRDLGATSEFTPWPVRVVGGQEALDQASTDGGVLALVTEVAKEICASEFPIEERRFHYLVCRAFGFTRMQGSREEQVMALLRGAPFVTDPTGFVWPTDANPAELTGYRWNCLDHIQLDEIHPTELRNLVGDVMRSLPSDTGEEDLLRAVFERLGAGRHRLTKSVREKLTAVLGDVRA